MKVKEIIKLLEDDGWYLVAQKSSSIKIKPAALTVPLHGKNKDLAKGTENSILKQAGLK